MRGASKVTLQPHQILRLPRNSEFKISAENPWIASAKIKTIRRPSDDNPSSRTRRLGDLPRPTLETHFVWKNKTFRAPAIYQNFTKCCACHEASHMKRHLQCAEQQTSYDKFTKYCACCAKWTSWLIRVTYETSLTMRGATNVTRQVHQILCLPRKMNLMIDPRHIWNVMYNARSNKRHTTSSPNTAPTTQNESHAWSASHMKRHLQLRSSWVARIWKSWK